MKFDTTLMPLYSLPETDAELYVRWMWGQRKQTIFDPATLSYVRACMAKVSQNDQTLMLLPFHPVLMFESVARLPGLSEGKSAMSFWSIGQMIDQVAQQTGHAEGYFVTADPELAETCSHHGWEIYMRDPVKGLFLLKRKFPKLPVSMDETTDEQL